MFLIFARAKFVPGRLRAHVHMQYRTVAAHEIGQVSSIIQTLQANKPQAISGGGHSPFQSYSGNFLQCINNQ